jgi:hypothetical protein
MMIIEYFPAGIAAVAMVARFALFLPRPSIRRSRQAT